MNIDFDMEILYEYVLTGTRVEKENTALRAKTRLQDSLRFRILPQTLNLAEQWGMTGYGVPEKDSLWSAFSDKKAELESIAIDKDKIWLDFAREHPDYTITPYLIDRLIFHERLDRSSAMQLYESLPEKSKKSIMGQLAAIRLEYLSDVSGPEVGDIAYDFCGNGFSGNQVRLSDYRDTLVLLDFWASWCGPCLKQIPKIKELQANYSERGLVIVGVSSDDDPLAWEAAIRDHELTAYHHILSDEPSKSGKRRYFSNYTDIGTHYAIAQIPYYILVDKQGRIAARWDHMGDEEMKVIETMLER